MKSREANLISLFFWIILRFFFLIFVRLCIINWTNNSDYIMENWEIDCDMNVHRNINCNLRIVIKKQTIILMKLLECNCNLFRSFTKKKKKRNCFWNYEESKKNAAFHSTITLNFGEKWKWTVMTHSRLLNSRFEQKCDITENNSDEYSDFI